MAAVLKHWREAATLILVTSSKLSSGATPQLTSSISKPLLELDSPSAASDNFDILLLKRSSKSTFLPNMYVFPGGVAVNSDFSAQWLSVFKKLGADTQQALFRQLSEGSSSAAPMFSRERDPAFSVIPSEVAFRICAIRETFEESGVLLALPVDQSRRQLNSFFARNASPSPSSISKDPTVIKAWRQRVNNNPDEFLSMCLELELVPEIWSLYEWANWLSPFMPDRKLKRFDTAFFVCCIDHKPDAVEDAAETVKTVWASPRSLLAAYYEQEEGLAPPQIYELSKLVRFQTASDLLRFVSQPDRARVEQYLTCSFRTKDHDMAVLPGDDLYLKLIELSSSGELSSNESIPQFKSLDDLNRKYYNHNKLIILSVGSNLLVTVLCTIPPLKGHVNPDMKVLDNIRTKAKL